MQGNTEHTSAVSPEIAVCYAPQILDDASHMLVKVTCDFQAFCFAILRKPNLAAALDTLGPASAVCLTQDTLVMTFPKKCYLG